MQKKLKIKKGDTVKVIAGAALGQEGVILDVDYSKERVFVEGLSVINKKHVKPQTDKLKLNNINEIMFFSPEWLTLLPRSPKKFCENKYPFVVESPIVPPG